MKVHDLVNLIGLKTTFLTYKKITTRKLKR
jgi:hypothetical protein